MKIDPSNIHCLYSSVSLSVFAPYLLVSFIPLILFCSARLRQGHITKKKPVHLSSWLDFKHIYFLSYCSLVYTTQVDSNMKMSNNPTKYEVLIKQYLRSILDISAVDNRMCHLPIRFSVID